MASDRCFCLALGQTFTWGRVSPFGSRTVPWRVGAVESYLTAEILRRGQVFVPSPVFGGPDPGSRTPCAPPPASAAEMSAPIARLQKHRRLTVRLAPLPRRDQLVKTVNPSVHRPPPVLVKGLHGPGPPPEETPRPSFPVVCVLRRGRDPPAGGG